MAYKQSVNLGVNWSVFLALFPYQHDNDTDASLVDVISEKWKPILLYTPYGTHFAFIEESR